jgi:hypothetical protein
MFRALYTRKLRRTFNGLITNVKLKSITDGISEWDCFKLLLPRTVRALLFGEKFNREESLKILEKMSNDIGKG